MCKCALYTINYGLYLLVIARVGDTVRCIITIILKPIRSSQLSSIFPTIKPSV